MLKEWYLSTKDVLYLHKEFGKQINKCNQVYKGNEPVFKFSSRVLVIYVIFQNHGAQGH